MYRSKDKKFMDSIKKSVLSVTQGNDKDSRKYAIDFLKTYVRMDDLHLYAIKDFPKSAFSFGDGSYSPDMMIVTKDPIDEDTRSKLTRACSKAGIGEDSIYFAHLRFVKTKKKQDARQKIFDKMVHILKPKYILSFDNVTSDTYDELAQAHYIFPFGTEVVSNPDKKEAKKDISNALKQIKEKIAH